MTNPPRPMTCTIFFIFSGLSAAARYGSQLCDLADTQRRQTIWAGLC